MNDNFNNYKNEEERNIIDSEAYITDLKEVKPKNKKKRHGAAKLIASSLVFGLVAGAAFQGYGYVYNLNNSDTTSGVTTDTNSNSNNLNDGVVALETGTQSNNVTSDVSTVVDNVMPSIVAINSTVNKTNSDYFGRQYNEQLEGSGSGIIIGQNDSEILIATNNHVIAESTNVEIVFADDTKATATIKGTAPASDLAVVSVNVNDLSADTISKIKIATLGDSNSLKLGEMAIAIGNALGYGQSITVGYVSALDREVTVDNVTLDVLQTDAAINPGNSGGALLNTKGEVIGINSVKYVDDSVESVGYAIPISDAIPIINDLMNRTTIADNEKASLGIGGQEVTSDYAQNFNLPVGIYVGEVKKGTAAEKAGLVVGDIIVGLNNTKVETMSDLQEVLDYTKAGSTGTITVKSLNNGEYTDKTLNITFDGRTSK
jgi:serine protease Do